MRLSTIQSAPKHARAMNETESERTSARYKSQLVRFILSMESGGWRPRRRSTRTSRGYLFRGSGRRRNQIVICNEVIRTGTYGRFRTSPLRSRYSAAAIVMAAWRAAQDRLI